MKALKREGMDGTQKKKPRSADLQLATFSWQPASEMLHCTSENCRCLRRMAGLAVPPPELVISGK